MDVQQIGGDGAELPFTVDSITAEQAQAEIQRYRWTTEEVNGVPFYVTEPIAREQNSNPLFWALSEIGIVESHIKWNAEKTHFQFRVSAYEVAGLGHKMDNDYSGLFEGTPGTKIREVVIPDLKKSFEIDQDASAPPPL